MNPSVELFSERLALRPLIQSDFEGLYSIASDPEIWKQHPVVNRYERDIFQKFFEEALLQNAFVVLDRASNKIIGSTRFYDFSAAKGEVAIGFTFLDRTYWGGSFNLELKNLMFSHAFQFVDRVLFHVGVENFRSQKALEKIGARLSGEVLREWKDRSPQTSLVYSIEKHFYRALRSSVEYLDSEEAYKALDVDLYWPKWNSPWWHITLLWEMGLLNLVPRRILETIFDKVDDHYIHFFPITRSEIPEGIDPYTQLPCHCYLGIFYQVMFETGFDVDQKLPWIRDWFFKYQLPDGGLNCYESVYCKPDGASSIVSSLPVFESMLLIRGRDYTSREKEFLDRGYRYLLQRKLFRSLRNEGKVMDQNFLKILFPRFYEYDVLRGLSFIMKYCTAFQVEFPVIALKESLDVVQAHLSPLNEIRLSRKDWTLEKTYQKNETGTWAFGAPSTGFALLESASAVGSTVPYFKNDIQLLKKYL